MRYSVFKSIRTHLILLVLISVLPALGIVIYSGLNSQRHDIQEAEHGALMTLQNLSYEQERTMESARQFLSLLSKMPDVQNLNVPSCKKLFKTLLEENQLYATIFLADAGGTVIANALPSAPFSIRERNYFKNAVKTKAFSIGEYMIGVASRRPVLPFAYPVVDSSGKVRGVLAGGFDLVRYGAIFTDIKLPEHVAFAIFDRAHTHLYRHPDPEKLTGAPDSPDMVKHMSAGVDTGIFTAAWVDGKRRFGAYKRFYLKGDTSPCIFMRVGIIEEKALANAKKTFIMNIVLLSFAFIAALASAWFLGNVIITKRLNKLVDASRQLAQGNLAARTGLNHSNSELGQLATAFDQMADNLVDREGALRESRQQLQNIIDFLPDATFVIDNDMKVIAWNRAMEETTGIRKEDMIGQGDHAYTVPYYGERRSNLLDLIDASDEDLKAKYEHIKRTGNVLSAEAFAPALYGGTGAYISAMVAPLYDIDGNRAGAIESVRDINERKLGEKEIIREKEKLKTLMENAPFGMVLIDRHGRFTYINTRFTDLFGYDISDVPDGRAWFRRAYPDAEYRHRVISAWEEDLGDAKPAERRPRVFTVICKDGSQKTVSFIPSALASGDSLMTCEDITERRQAEEQIKASLKEKEVLLREVHHRVKNNMQVISSLLNMQSRNVTDAKTVDILRASINRIRSMALIHDKLYQTEGLSRIDVCDYIQHLSSNLLSTYSVGPNITLDIDIDPFSLGIDTVMPLGILINELVTNSLKHAFPEEGPGRIGISLKNGDGQGLVLNVSDNGIGIPAGLNHKDTESMGMQLVITLVEQLNGTIELNRVNGTEFRIAFRAEG